MDVYFSRSGDRKFKAKVSTDFDVSWEPPCWVRRLRAVAYEGTDPILEGSTLMTKPAPQGPTFWYITLWVRTQHADLGDTNVQTIAELRPVFGDYEWSSHGHLHSELCAGKCSCFSKTEIPRTGVAWWIVSIQLTWWEVDTPCFWVASAPCTPPAAWRVLGPLPPSALDLVHSISAQHREAYQALLRVCFASPQQ